MHSHSGKWPQLLWRRLKGKIHSVNCWWYNRAFLKGIQPLSHSSGFWSVNCPNPENSWLSVMGSEDFLFTRLRAFLLTPVKWGSRCLPTYFISRGTIISQPTLVSVAQTILINALTLLPFVATMPTQTLVIKYHHVASATRNSSPLKSRILIWW